MQPPSQFNYTYLPNSNFLVSITGPVITVTNTWEATRNVLASKENKVDTTVISSYNVNHLGKRTGVSQAGTAFQAVRSIEWGYDPYGQVITPDSDNSADDRAYQYDAIGNCLQGSAGVSPAYDDDGNATAYPLPANLGSNFITKELTLMPETD